MTHDRLHALTDGIFAIVMTLLVLELKVPHVDGASNAALWSALKAQSAIFVSYLISFAVLFVYWRAHNFVITILAKNINVTLVTINSVFLLLVGLVPFTTELLGRFAHTPLAHCAYALNVILIGLTLIYMRAYVERSDSIDSLARTQKQRGAALMRTLTPIICALVAIPISFLNTNVSFGILLFAVAFNFHPNAGEITLRIFRPLIRLVYTQNK